MYVSVIMPVYNEEGNIERVSVRVLNTLKQKNIEGELLLINDGSTDGSLDKCQRMASEYTGLVRVINNERNLGQSWALRKGFDNAKGDTLVTLDSDGQHNTEDIPKFLDEICSGYNFVKGRRINRVNSFRRHLMSACYNQFLGFTMGLPFEDFNSGYVALTKACANNIGFDYDEIDKYSQLHVYLMALAIIHGYRVEEIPIEQCPRMSGQSSLSFRKNFGHLLRDHVLFMIEHWRELKQHRAKAYS